MLSLTGQETAAVAASYTQRGWRVIQLHDVTTGACSCRDGQYCKSAGKHPIWDKWQAGSWLSTPPEVYAAWAARPQANVGIVTGPPSGIWALDVDPLHDGHNRLAELELAFGPLPKTYTVRTGSGGMHLYFAMTGVDFDLTNSRGRLPLGLDVRGRGGYVVAPPSVSDRGAYAVLADPDAAALRAGSTP